MPPTKAVRPAPHRAVFRAPSVARALSLSRAQVAANITRLVALLDPKGAVARANPRAIGPNASAAVSIELERALPLEVFGDCAALGRFALRARGVTVAVGMVTEIAQADEPAS